MAGINAVSVTKTHNNSGADVATTGFLINERITLSASPTGSGYLWALAAPNDSVPVYSALDDDSDEGPAFTPDVAGFYTVSVLVNGVTQYVLRITVTDVAVARQAQGINLLPLANAQVPTPQAGVTIYYSVELGAPAKKDTSGTVTAL